MSNLPIINVTLSTISTGPDKRDDSAHGERFNVDEDYGTIAFGRDFMRRCIGMGEAIIVNGEFRGFNPRSSPGMLNVGIWLMFVPSAYREDVEHGAMYSVWDRFLMRKVDENTIPCYVDELREWIVTYIAPTDDPRPRRERFAAAWYEIGVRAAYDAGRITRAEAGELLRVKP